MGYSPSPRPTFDAPTRIAYADVTRHLWGDEASGRVADWIYVSSDKIHQLLFGLPPGGAFHHSDAFRTVFAADEVLYVLSGTMVLANPETGKVQRVESGQGAFFRRDTWHHAFNHSTEPLRVLELFAPPPSQGTSGSYAQTKPDVTEPRYVQQEWIGRWPMAREKARDLSAIRVLDERDALWRLEGDDRKTLVGLYVATEHLTVGKIRLLPGEVSDARVHGGDTSMYVLGGTPNVLAHEESGQSWFELGPRDGFYLPSGTPYQYYNMTGEVVELLFGVAPDYLAGSS